MTWHASFIGRPNGARSETGEPQMVHRITIDVDGETENDARRYIRLTFERVGYLAFDK